MRSSTVTLVLVLSSVGIAGAAEFRTGQPVMGTILEVTVVADDVDRARSAAEAAVAVVRRWDDVLTTWRPQGELATLNRAAGKGPVGISPALHQALVQMIALAAETGGAFDPAVGPFVLLWRTLETPGAHPVDGLGPRRIGAALALEQGTASLAAGAALDAGAIGKGIGLDAAVALLRAAGIRQAFLDFGGSSQIALGAPDDSPQGWPVAVAGLGDDELRGVVTLRDAALSTSRTRVPQAAEGTVIDPRSGRPVTEPRVATVKTRTAAGADAWSTALVVLGRDGVEKARRAGAEVFIEDSDGAIEEPEFIEGSS